MAYEFDPNRPIYRQIVQEIKTRTIQGTYVPGGRLPSAREMSEELGVNPNTVARAYMELEREGFITTRRGEGSTVVEDQSRIEAERKRLLQDAVARFADEVKHLKLTDAQGEDLLEAIREALRNG